MGLPRGSHPLAVAWLKEVTRHPGVPRTGNPSLPAVHPARSNHRRPPRHPGATETPRQGPQKNQSSVLCPSSSFMSRLNVFHKVRVDACVRREDADGGPHGRFCKRSDASAQRFADRGLGASLRLPARAGPGTVPLSVVPPESLPFSGPTFLVSNDISPSHGGCSLYGGEDKAGSARALERRPERLRRAPKLVYLPDNRRQRRCRNRTWAPVSRAHGPAPVGCAGTGAAVTMKWL